MPGQACAEFPIAQPSAAVLVPSRTQAQVALLTSLPGVQVPGDEADGKDEALCGSDMNVITDEDLKGILVKLPHNCKFTFIAGGPLSLPLV